MNIIIINIIWIDCENHQKNFNGWYSYRIEYVSLVIDKYWVDLNKINIKDFDNEKTGMIEKISNHVKYI